MKSETAAFMQKSGKFLVKAQSMLKNGWPDEAGRAAYLAGFHAAQAWIFETAGRVSKTHTGVHSQFARAARDCQRFSEDDRRFLGRAYNLKAIADYATGRDADITVAQATETIKMAHSFVTAVASLIEANPPAPNPPAD